MGEYLRSHRGALCGAGGQALRRLVPVAHRGDQPQRGRLVLEARPGRRARHGGASSRHALRPLLLRRPRLDLSRHSHGFHGWRHQCHPPRQLPRLCRRPGARADRTLCPRHPVERRGLARNQPVAGRPVHLLLRRCARRCRQRPLVALEPADVDRQDLNGSADDRWCRSPPGHRRRRPHPTPAAPLRCPHP